MNDNVTRCPHCGQAIVPKPEWLGLSRQERMVVMAVAERPRSAEALRTVLWGHDPNGGPSDRALYTVVSHANTRLRPYGVKVEQGSDGLYRFVEGRNGNQPGDNSRGGAGVGAGVRPG